MMTFQQQPSPSSNSASRTPSAFSASRRVIAVTSTEKESKSSSASATASVRLTSKDPSFQTPETIINCVNTVNEEFPSKDPLQRANNSKWKYEFATRLWHFGLTTNDLVEVQDEDGLTSSKNV
ncbi:hypothetical protein C0J52_20681 [Blattella germanica]|nr:hypothetical protein C0J52_20681 [Blattella germanica]